MVMLDEDEAVAVVPPPTPLFLLVLLVVPLFAVADSDDDVDDDDDNGGDGVVAEKDVRLSILMEISPVLLMMFEEEAVEAVGLQLLLPKLLLAAEQELLRFNFRSIPEEVAMLSEGVGLVVSLVSENSISWS